MIIIALTEQRTKCSCLLGLRKFDPSRCLAIYHAIDDAEIFLRRKKIESKGDILTQKIVIFTSAFARLTDEWSASKRLMKSMHAVDIGLITARQASQRE